MSFIQRLFINFSWHVIIKFFRLGWFGIRKDFCHFLLGLFPFLQEYGNISYQPRDERDQPPSEPMITEKSEKLIKKIDLMKPVVPIISIDMPD